MSVDMKNDGKGVNKKMLKKLKQIAVGVGAAVATVAPAFASGEPLDLTAAGTTLAGYVAVAAGAALALWLAFMGIKVIIRSFKAVK